ncbi:MAG: hypothetical protein P794_00175 [Epsilonproteobacteria bacterium (ex Lamellibrachia satsuma)]|nr:MAG: hypothetical protein P794_00175 [Epsilonproteobacteria bacterium (ex Lamellibrachia satsuma)]
MIKTRVQALEKKMNIGDKRLTWYCVSLQDGVYTTDDHKILTKDKEGSFFYEDGRVFYDTSDENIGLITREYV